LIVDAHAHIGRVNDLKSEPETLIAEMKKSGVTKAVISPMGKDIIFDNAKANSKIAEIVKRFPRKFVGFAVANPWLGSKSVLELERAISKLGLRGLILHPELQGFQADDEIVDPVVEKAQRLQIPIYIPVGTPTCSTPHQLDLLAKRHPKAILIMGHMGYPDLAPYVLPVALKNSNIMLETSRVPELGLIEDAVRRLGAERVIFGSDYPYSRYELEVETVRLLNISSADREMILGKSLLALLGKGR